MTARKKPVPQPAPAGHTITNSSFVVNATNVNEHTRAAVEALAVAAAANAEAIKAAAEALKGAPATTAPMIHLGGTQ